MSHHWIRVSKSNPCPVCSRGDWCCIGDHWINCMRVQSDKPCDNGGWLHTLSDDIRPRVERKPERPPPTINAKAMIFDWMDRTTVDMLGDLSESLGIDLSALLRLMAAWAPEHRAWAFPMFNGHGSIVGIRLRSNSGAKWAVPGSHQGIFVPIQPPEKTVVICEGPTDTAAALSLGFYSLGRPSCCAGRVELAISIGRMRIREAIIVSDNDDPGINGARKLAESLPIPSVIFIPPAKDIRQFVNLGGTKEMVESTVSASVWNQPCENAY